MIVIKRNKPSGMLFAKPKSASLQSAVSFTRKISINNEIKNNLIQSFDIWPNVALLIKQNIFRLKIPKRMKA